MDVYLGTVPKMLTEDELFTAKTSIAKPAVLFFREKYFKRDD